MPSSQTQSLCQSLPWTVFHQVGSLLKQTVSGSLIFTESIFSCHQSERFVVVVSQKFSALLQAEEFSDSLLSSELTPLSLTVNSTDSAIATPFCNLRLTFEPDAIASFLVHLETLLLSESDTFQQLKSAKNLLQPNNATVQSEFTLKLIELLATAQTSNSPLSFSGAAEAALRQQVEQEQLMNEVTTLIRQSLELPVILETAVQQVRQFLQADRLIIYQFNIPAPSCLLDASLDESPLWQTSAPSLEGITYEARVNDSIPSVLHLMEEHHAASLLGLRQTYQDGLTWAIDHSEANATSAGFVHLPNQVLVRAELVTPIVVREELWGLLIAHQCFEPRQWQEHEKVFLRRIAGHLAIAIYQAKLYAQVHQQKQTLEQQVGDRTQELRDTLVTAQAASRAKSEFLATMSHELRSPLTTIIGMASTLLRYHLSQSDTKGALTLQKQQEYLQTIQNRGEHLLALINDILDLSQVETGKAILEIREFSLFELAQHSLKSLQARAEQKKVELNLDLKLGSETIDSTLKSDRFKADYQRVKQILLNLLSNAIKFTPENGSVTLRVWLNDDTAILQVEDTGIGISEQQLPLLFQKFQQLDASYHRKYEGTGLGLALTKQLVELHGGTIEVSSTVGMGSRFTVHLPTQALSALDQVTQKRQPLSSLYPRIVLIESDEETATLICNLLTAANYHVVWMVESTMALKQVEMLQPVAVIVDTQLPRMQSYEVIRRLQQDFAHSIKILALIAETDFDAQILSLEAGADDFLAKPITQPEQLIDKVTALVRK